MIKVSTMQSKETCTLAITGDSSGIKFEPYHAGEALAHRRYGKIHRIGLSVTNQGVHGMTGTPEDGHSIGVSNFTSESNFLPDWLGGRNSLCGPTICPGSERAGCPSGVITDVRAALLGVNPPGVMRFAAPLPSEDRCDTSCT